MVTRAMFAIGLFLMSTCWMVTAAEPDLQVQINDLHQQLLQEQDQRSKLEAQVNNLVDSVKTFMDECESSGSFTCSVYGTDTYRVSSCLPGHNQYSELRKCSWFKGTLTGACGTVDANWTTTAAPPTDSTIALTTTPTISSSRTPHPAFTAGLSNDQDSCEKHETIKFNSVKLNVMNGYDPRTGVFTAPVAGSYAFTSTLSVEPNNQYHVAIVKNAVTNSIAYLLADQIDLWLERSTTVLTHLDVGERVWMTCMGRSRIEGDHGHIWEGASDYHSHFSGFLISAD